MFSRERQLACSFCGKDAADVAKLVAGRSRFWRRRVYICDGCVQIASRIMQDGGDDVPVAPARTEMFLKRLRRALFGFKRQALQIGESGAV